MSKQCKLLKLLEYHRQLLYNMMDSDEYTAEDILNQSQIVDKYILKVTRLELKDNVTHNRHRQPGILPANELHAQ
ncbi:MAG: hypothetical protein GX660_18360 [Clostridiaceae bacterium]|nr:hypothetical protein [Clostridiaceae bacterium]